jgi:hypothetical protein
VTTNGAASRTGAALAAQELHKADRLDQRRSVDLLDACNTAYEAAQAR